MTGRLGRPALPGPAAAGPSPNLLATQKAPTTTRHLSSIFFPGLPPKRTVALSLSSIASACLLLLSHFLHAHLAPRTRPSLSISVSASARLPRLEQAISNAFRLFLHRLRPSDSRVLKILLPGSSTRSSADHHHHQLSQLAPHSGSSQQPCRPNFVGSLSSSAMVPAERPVF